MRAVVALIHLDRPAIWVSDDETAPSLAVLMTAEHLGPERLQRRIQRRHPAAISVMTPYLATPTSQLAISGRSARPAPDPPQGRSELRLSITLTV